MKIIDYLSIKEVRVIRRDNMCKDSVKDRDSSIIRMNIVNTMSIIIITDIMGSMDIDLATNIFTTTATKNHFMANIINIRRSILTNINSIIISMMSVITNIRNIFIVKDINVR